MQIQSKKMWGALGAGLGVIGMLASAAVADIKYTQAMQMGEWKAGATPSSTTTRYVGPNAERTETRTKLGAAEMTQVHIQLCDKNQMIQLDNALKIYTVKPINEHAPVAGAAGANTPANVQQKTGKIVSTYSVKDLGEETVAGFKTRRYLVTTDMQGSGCAADTKMNTKVEIWVADIRDANPCAKLFEGYSGYASMTKPECKITFEQKGDVEAFTKAYNGLIMRQKMYMGDKLLMTTEVTSLSQAKLDNEPFTIPAGFKQVSAEEFQRQQTAAMMQAMMGGMTFDDE